MIISEFAIVMAIGFGLYIFGVVKKMPALTASGGIVVMLCGALLYDEGLEVKTGESEVCWICVGTSENTTITYQYSTPPAWFNNSLSMAIFWIGFFGILTGALQKREISEEAAMQP